MPPIRTPLRIQAGSYDPIYWAISDSVNDDPIDLTAPGYTVKMVVEDGRGHELLNLTDSAVFRRTANGRAYFEPSSALTTTWPSMWGTYQIELTHPSGETVRIAQGSFSVDDEYIKS